MEDTISVLVIGKNAYESNLDLCAAARAFGASNVTFASPKNGRLIKYFKSLNRRWGGTFSVDFTNNWREFLKTKKNYKIVYLTRYGVPINKVEYTLKTYKNILIIVTITEAAKNLYQMADFNVSITTQPHAATSAVAVFLHHFFEGRELSLHFENAQYKIVPEERRVHVEKTKQQ